MTGKKEYPELRIKSVETWKRWLQEHHADAKVAWVVSLNKGQAKLRGEFVPFDMAMIRDEALCWGWVDSLLRKIDDREYRVKFTPRKDRSTWSELNKKRVEVLMAEGRMTPAGKRCIEVAKANGMCDKGIKLPQVDDSLPGAFLNAFHTNADARDGYFSLPERAQKQYNIWINIAKRAQTMERRVEEAIDKLSRGEELGLK